MENLIRIPAGGRRERFLPLLLLADESENQVRSYMQLGDLYVYGSGDDEDAAERNAAGVALAIPHSAPTDEEGCVELKAVAVDPRRQGQGLGLRMLRAVIDDLRARGVKRVIVGTGNAGIGQIAFIRRPAFDCCASSATSSRRRAAIRKSWKTTASS